MWDEPWDSYPDEASATWARDHRLVLMGVVLAAIVAVGGAWVWLPRAATDLVDPPLTIRNETGYRLHVLVPSGLDGPPAGAEGQVIDPGSVGTIECRYSVDVVDGAGVLVESVPCLGQTVTIGPADLPGP